MSRCCGRVVRMTCVQQWADRTHANRQGKYLRKQHRHETKRVGLLAHTTAESTAYRTGRSARCFQCDRLQQARDTRLATSEIRPLPFFPFLHTLQKLPSPAPERSSRSGVLIFGIRQHILPKRSSHICVYFGKRKEKKKQRVFVITVARREE